MKLELDKNPSKADAALISKGLRSSNESRIPEIKGQDEDNFSVFARDEEGEIMGGLRAVCFWNTLHIELIWVDEDQRHKGLGSKLVAAAEAYARDRGVENAFLETTDWQAREFYEKHDYMIMGHMEDYPKGHTMYFMTKKLASEKGTS